MPSSGGWGGWEQKEEPEAKWCLPVFQTAPPEQGAQAGLRGVYVPARLDAVPVPMLVCFKNPRRLKSVTTTQIF